MYFVFCIMQLVYSLIVSQFKNFVSNFLISFDFYLLVLSVTEINGLKSPTVVMNLAVSLRFCQFCFIHFGAMLLGHLNLDYFMSSG